MKVYAYCSYKGSPTGYEIGTFVYDENKTGFYVPEKKDVDPIVRKALESGLVENVYGKLWNSNSYIMLIKNIRYVKPNSEDFGSIKYGTFAFEFDSFDEYSAYSGLKNADKSRLAELLDKFLIPDVDIPDYAMKINASAFADFIRNIRVLENDVINDEKKFFYVKLKFDDSDYTDKVSELFGVTLYNIGGKLYTNDVKKKINVANVISWVIAAIIITLTISRIISFIIRIIMKIL